MKNYFCLLIKIHNDNTRKFQIISNEIENYLSINHQKYKEKINIYAEDKNPSQNQLNWFVKTFDFFSSKSYCFLDVYEKPNKKRHIIFLLIFSCFMLSVLGLMLFEIFYLKPCNFSILNTAIGEKSDNQNFNYSVPFMIIMAQFSQTIPG